MNTQKMYDLLKLLFFALISSFFIIQISNAASLHLEWDTNDEEDLAGYRVYYGNSSGNYGEPVDVENATQHELSGLNNAETYYIALTAYDKFNNESEKSYEISGVAQLSLDTQDPSIAITSPTSSITYATGSGAIVIGGTISDNLTVTQVIWFNNRGGSGTASATASWWYVPSITLQEGDNIITLTASDAAGNTGTDTLSITYTPLTSSSTSIIATTTTTTPATTTLPAATTTPATTTAPVTTTLPSTTSTVPLTSTVPVTTSIPNDTSPPIGTITINNGNKTTNSPDVTLSLFATDAGGVLSTGSFMIFSNDNQEWSDPEPYTNSRIWTLSPRKGTKVVYVKFRDAAGKWMTDPAQDQIKLTGSRKKLQPVSISSTSEFLPFWAKGNAIDENPLSFWSTLISIFWKNESLILDLGEVKLIDRVDIYASSFFSTNFFPVNFKIEISNDNNNWQEIHTVKDYAIQATHSDSWNFNSFAGRYIRVYITKAKTFFFFFYLAQIAEMQVYGYDLPEQQPEERPVTTPSIKDGSPVNEGQEETGEESDSVAGTLQVTPGIPGIPMITLN